MTALCVKFDGTLGTAAIISAIGNKLGTLAANDKVITYTNGSTVTVIRLIV